MQTSNAILFKHSRIESVLVNDEYTTTEVSYGNLPLFYPKSISVDKQTIKIYYPYSNQKAIYYVTGQQKVVKLKGWVASLDEWREVFTNDILTIEEFVYPTWNVILGASTDWWVDIKTLDTSSGRANNGALYFSVELDLNERSD